MPLSQLINLHKQNVRTKITYSIYLPTGCRSEAGNQHIITRKHSAGASALFMRPLVEYDLFTLQARGFTNTGYDLITSAIKTTLFLDEDRHVEAELLHKALNSKHMEVTPKNVVFLSFSIQHTSANAIGSQASPFIYEQ